MEAGELHVKGGASKLAEADFTYNVVAWKPSVVQNLNRTPPELSITQATGGSTSGDTTNRWDLALNDQQPLEILAHLGAGEAHMNLGGLNLRNVELTVGASGAVVSTVNLPPDALHGPVSVPSSPCTYRS